MSGTPSDGEQSTALVLEVLPLVGGATIFLFTILTGLQPKDEDGRTWSWHSKSGSTTRYLYP
jgi:hypothetical protein